MTNRTLNASIAGVIGFFVAAIATYLVFSAIAWDIHWAADKSNTYNLIAVRFFWMMISVIAGLLAADTEAKRLGE